MHEFPVGGGRNTFEIELQNGLDRKLGILKPDAGKCPIIDVSVIVPVAAAGAFAEPAGGSHNDAGEAIRLTCNVSRCGHWSASSEAQNDINQVRSKPQNALRRDGSQALVAPRHYDREAVVVGPPHVVQ